METPSYIIRSRNFKRDGKELHEMVCFSSTNFKFTIYGINRFHCYAIKVKLGEWMACTCQEWKTLKPICEHIAFLLMYVFGKVDIPLDKYMVQEIDFLELETFLSTYYT